MYTRLHEPRAQDWRSFAWGGGSFDTARRPYTDLVEGTIRTPDHLVLLTLRGGARRLDVVTDCGHRFSGPDHAGAVSFLPAHCERRMRLTGVRSEWASIALSPAWLDRISDDDPACNFDFAPFSNCDDPFIAGLIGEFARLYAADGKLGHAYCEAMSHALASYMSRRYGRRSGAIMRKNLRLPPWRLRRIAEYVDAHIGRDILVSELAELVGVSAGHLHRAFRQTMGVTPLEYVTDRRIRLAMAIMMDQTLTITELALRVGFQSPSHFTRTFRRVTGKNPSAFRAEISR